MPGVWEGPSYPTRQPEKKQKIYYTYALCKHKMIYLYAHTMYKNDTPRISKYECQKRFKFSTYVEESCRSVHI